ncbi:MAG: DUF5658 family protein [Armatimonadota bacterium]
MSDGERNPPRADDDRRGRWRFRFRGPLRLRRAGEKEAFLLTVICMADMFTTLWWVVSGAATEANPMLGWTFRNHPAAFVAVKCASCIPALVLAPRLAQSKKRFTVWLLRLIIVLYVGLYFGLARF